MSRTRLLALSGDGYPRRTRLVLGLSSWQALLAGLMVVYTVIAALMILVFPLGEKATLTVSDLAAAVAATAAAVFAGLASVRSTGRMRLSWFLIGAGLAAWAAAEVIWSTCEVILGQEVPFPSIADIWYLGAVPPLLAGVVLLGSASRILARARTALDGIALVLAVSALVWRLVLLPTYSDSEATLIEKAVGGAYPLTDLVLFFGLVVALSHNRGGRAGLALWLFSAGMGIFLLGDIAFAYLSLSDSYATGSIIDVGWISGYLLMGYSAALCAGSQTEVAASQEGESGVSPAWRQAIPLALPVIVIAQLLIVGFDSVLVILGGLVFSLVLVRQWVVLTDNVRLNQKLVEARNELEGRIEQRTLELKRVNRKLTEARNELERRVEQRTLELKKVNRKLTWLAKTDGLTGIANHRALMEVLHDEVKRSTECDQPLAIMMMDIDGFKRFNDTHGHPEGDRALKRLARVMKKSFRRNDIIGRYGGDEFMAILPETDHEAAMLCATRLLETVSNEGFQLRRGDPVPLGISIGMAVCPQDSQQQEKLLAYADASLYEAKQASGSNVVVAHAAG